MIRLGNVIRQNCVARTNVKQKESWPAVVKRNLVIKRNSREKAQSPNQRKLVTKLVSTDTKYGEIHSNARRGNARSTAKTPPFLRSPTEKSIGRLLHDGNFARNNNVIVVFDEFFNDRHPKTTKTLPADVEL
ncbi:hypothetical protein K0M31_019023 [Melipona bicolor]|uniref:Uncharacterized protein n=1 Tax=Melipona bicolor TaxID=60889 RepID=A0AA40KDM6_9HYME|nr:hypothetical protein K0M31_019023 [Melipona bicolor]